MTTMTTEKPTFTQACRRYRTEAASDYVQPDKAASSRKGQGWLLIDEAGVLVAIVNDNGAVQYGAALAAWSRQFAQGQPSPARQPVIDGYHHRK